MTVILAVGDCFSAFLLGPVLQELRSRGITFRVVAGAEDRDIPMLRQLLGVDAELTPIAGAKQAIPWARALVQPGITCVVTLGTTPCTYKLAGMATHHGVRSIHLDAGIRAFGGSTRSDPTANVYCVATDTERLALATAAVRATVRPRNESEVIVVGDLVATAVAAAHPPADANDTGLAFVVEHFQIDDDIAVSTARAWAPLWPTLPRPPRDAAPMAWIDYVANARVVVTDSVAWQRVAVALGVPCVALYGTPLWPTGVAAGLVTEDSDGSDVALAVRRMATRSRAPASRPTGVATRIVDAMRVDGPSPTITLPSDGDASGRTFTNDEAALVTMVLQRGTLNSTRGTMVTAFEKRFATWLGSKHAIACASGSAAVHIAIAALKLQPGDEVVTTPITDMGAITPILYEGAVPVFADVDPVTLNVTVDSVKAQLTERTRAIVVTHLFGGPCDLDGLAALAQERGLVLIEDAAQAFGATWRGRKVGTFGKLGTFSLQQGKHITTGEGGLVATDDDELARRVFLFVNKAWGYGDKKPDHYFPALNYRLTELQGAVALAQLPKLDDVVAARRQVAAALLQALEGVPGLVLPRDPAHGMHSWWKFAFHVDARLVHGGPRALAQKLLASGIACAPHYIQKPAFECELFRDWRASPVTWLPLQHNPRRDRAAAMFNRTAYAGALGGLDSVVVLPINERYTQAHVDHVATAIRNAVGALQHA